MSLYRVIYTDLRSGTRQGEFDFYGLSYSHELNEAGSCSLTVPLNGTYTSLGPGRTAIYVLRDNVVVWSGIVWGISADVESNTLGLAARGWFSYYEKQVIAYNLRFGTNASPVDMTSVIFKGLIDEAHSRYNGTDIGIDTSTITASGKLRKRTYIGNEFQTFADAMSNLANLKQGFDFRFVSRVDSGDFVTEVFTRYPNTGRTTKHVFELGGNVTLLSYQSDAENMANVVFATSAGIGDKGTQKVVAVDNDNLATYPLFQRAITFNDERTKANLEDKAERELARGSAPAETLSIETTADTVPKLGSYEVGDRVRVRGSYGWLDIDDEYRITAFTVDVGAVEVVNIDLAPLTLFI